MLSATEIKNIKKAREVFKAEYEERIHISLEAKIDDLVERALQNGETRIQINVSTLYNHIDKYRDEIILRIKEDYQILEKDYAEAVVDLAESDIKTQESILPFRKESAQIAMNDYAQKISLPATAEGYTLTITL